MNPYLNEEVAWERLKDIQREVENSRLITEGAASATARLVRLLGERIWWLAGLAARRAPRPRVFVASSADEGEAA